MAHLWEARVRPNGGKKPFTLDPSLMSKSLSRNHAKPQEGAHKDIKPDELARPTCQPDHAAAGEGAGFGGTESSALTKPHFVIYLSRGSSYRCVRYRKTSSPMGL